jgi:hypothetical protein
MQLALFDETLPQSPYANVRAVQPELANLVVGFDWDEREPTGREAMRLARQIAIAGEMVRGVTLAIDGPTEETIDFGEVEIQEQEATMTSIKNDFSHGYHAGYHNIVSALLANRENESFRLGFTAGRDAKLGEHPFTGNIIFESPGMTNFARRGKAGTQ